MLAMVIICYDLFFLVIGTFFFYGILMSYVRACSRSVHTRHALAEQSGADARACGARRARCRRFRLRTSTTFGSPCSPR